jgi:hypothetical protein
MISCSTGQHGLDDPTGYRALWTQGDPNTPHRVASLRVASRRPDPSPSRTHLETLQTLDKLLTRLFRLRIWEIHLVAPEELWFLEPTPLRHPLRHLAHHDLHHGEVFEVVVRLEEGVASEKFDEDTADREHVAGVGPREA